MEKMSYNSRSREQDISSDWNLAQDTNLGETERTEPRFRTGYQNDSRKMGKIRIERLDPGHKV